MGFMDSIRQAVRGVVPAMGAPREEFPRTLTETDLIADTSAVAGKYNLLGTGYTVPAQQEYFVGQGTPEKDMNQGYIYVYLKTSAGVEIPGKIRIAIYDANDRLKGILYEEEEEILHGDLSNRQSKQALPVRRDVVAAKDDYIAILFKPDTSSDVALTASKILLPVTNRWVRA